MEMLEYLVLILEIITTGEGGLILTNEKKIFDYCRQYHDHGHLNIPLYQEEMIKLKFMDLTIGLPSYKEL